MIRVQGIIKYPDPFNASPPYPQAVVRIYDQTQGPDVNVWQYSFYPTFNIVGDVCFNEFAFAFTAFVPIVNVGVADWRIIAKIEDGALLILVLRLANRRDVYRK